MKDLKILRLWPNSGLVCMRLPITQKILTLYMYILAMHVGEAIEMHGGCTNNLFTAII